MEGENKICMSLGNAHKNKFEKEPSFLNVLINIY